MWGRIAIAAAVLAAVSGCGGGGSGSGGVPVVAVPTPTPTPSPTATVAATRFQVESGGGMVADIRFYRGATVQPGSGSDARYFTDRTGLFFLRNPAAVDTPFTSQTLVDDGGNAIAAFGIDQVSGLALNLRAPQGATVVSPVTSLIYEVGDQAAVKRALQLAGGNFQLNDQARDLRTFSAVASNDAADTDTRSDARRLRAANIRLLAFNAALYRFALGPGFPVNIETMLYTQTYEDLAATIRANPGIQLYSTVGTEAALRAVPRRNNNRAEYRDDVVAAAVRLVNVYAVAIFSQVNDDETAARYLLGIQGFLLPELGELLTANSAAAAARVAQFTPDTVFAGTAAFLDRPTISTSLLFPGPDFLRVAIDGTATIPLYDPLSNGSPSHASNDITAFMLRNSGRLALTGVTVPAKFAAVLTATAQADESVRVQLRGGFTGVAWFDYGVRATDGSVATGRSFLIVR